MLSVLQARLIRTIELSGIAYTWSLVQDIIRALQVAAPQKPPAIAITMPLGIKAMSSTSFASSKSGHMHSVLLHCLAAAGCEFLSDCENLLIDILVVLNLKTRAPWLDLCKVAKMTHLTFLTLTGNGNGGTNKMPSLNKLTLQHIRVLANLRTLTLVGFKKPDLDLQWLQPLRSLSLGACHTDLCDLTSFTQLTSLAITWDLRRPRDIGVRKPRRLAAHWQQHPAATAVCFSSVRKFGQI